MIHQANEFNSGLYGSQPLPQERRPWQSIWPHDVYPIVPWTQPIWMGSGPSGIDGTHHYQDPHDH